MALTRYDLDHCDGESGECGAKMERQTHGDWVEWSEADTEIENLKSEIEDLKDRLQRIQDVL